VFLDQVQDQEVVLVADRALEVGQGLVREVDLAQVRDQDQVLVADQGVVQEPVLVHLPLNVAMAKLTRTVSNVMVPTWMG